MDKKKMNGHGYIPIKLYSQNKHRLDVGPQATVCQPLDGEDGEDDEDS